MDCEGIVGKLRANGFEENDLVGEVRGELIMLSADQSVFRESSRGAFFKKAASRTYLGGLSNVPSPGLTFGGRRGTINKPVGGEMI